MQNVAPAFIQPYVTAQTLQKAGPVASDQYGSSVAVLGSNFVVGTPNDSSSGISQAGKVYVYNGTTGALLLTLQDPNQQANDHFGSSVAAVGSNILVERQA